MGNRAQQRRLGPIQVLQTRNGGAPPTPGTGAASAAAPAATTVNPASEYVPKKLPWRGPATLPDSVKNDGILYLTGLAYSKLCFWRDIQEKEVSCWGVIHPTNSFVVTDMVLVHQEVTAAYTEMQEDHISFLTDYFIRHNIYPRDWLTYWFHTHPKGMGPQPSGQDNTTFNSDRQAKANVSIMGILATNGDWSCRMRTIANGGKFNNDPRAVIMTSEIKVAVLGGLFPDEGFSPTELREEFNALVKERVYTSSYSGSDFYSGSRGWRHGGSGTHDYSNYVHTSNAKKYDCKNIIELALYAVEQCQGKQRCLDMSADQISNWADFIESALHFGPCMMLFRYAMPVDRNAMCTKLTQRAQKTEQLKPLAKRLRDITEAFAKSSDEAAFSKAVFSEELDLLFKAYERFKGVNIPQDRFEFLRDKISRVADTAESTEPATQKATKINTASNPGRSINGRILPIHISVDTAMFYMECLQNGETKTSARALVADLTDNKTLGEAEYTELDNWCEQYAIAYGMNGGQSTVAAILDDGETQSETDVDPRSLAE
jgi:hypothetical protein